LALYEPQSLAILERSLLIRGASNVGIAELFDHPNTLISPQFTRGFAKVNMPPELIDAEFAEAKDQQSIWEKHRPYGKWCKQPYSEGFSQLAGQGE
jgi:hypothetical protein